MAPETDRATGGHREENQCEWNEQWAQKAQDKQQNRKQDCMVVQEMYKDRSNC